MLEPRVVEKIKTHFVFNNFFPRKSCRYMMTYKRLVEWGRPHTVVRRMRITCWIIKAASTLSQSHCENLCTNAPQRDIVLALPVLLKLFCPHEKLSSGGHVLQSVG